MNMAKKKAVLASREGGVEKGSRKKYPNCIWTLREESFPSIVVCELASFILKSCELSSSLNSVNEAFWCQPHYP